MSKGYSDAELRCTIKLFNKAKGNATDAAGLAKVPQSTFKNRLIAARNKFPHLLKEFERSKGGNPGLTKQQKDQAFEAFCASGYVKTRAAQILGLPAKTFRDRLTGYVREHGVDLTKLKPAPTLADHVATHRTSTEHQSARAKLKDATRRIVELEDKIKDLEWAAQASFAPAQWTLPTHPRKKREHMPYLLTSDFQVGEVIRAEETEAGYGYDSDIFRRRYRRLIDTTIYLSIDHGGKLWKYPGIIYSRGGDTISGGIHDELRETDDMTPIEACECVFEEESAGIEKLADAFGRVEVKSPDAAGNHDRDTFKPRSKKAGAHSYDRLISYMLRRHFKNDKRVTFQTSESFDVLFPIYNMNILLTHGDRMGSRGGQGFIGPAATILRGAQKVIMEQAALGRRVDRVDHGHFHTPIIMDWVLSNGCLPGYSEYAKSFRMRPTPPVQMLLYHHPRRGVVDYKPINLVEA